MELTERIRVKLTGPELFELGLKVAQADEHIEALEGQKDVMMADIKAQIKAAKKEAKKLARRRIDEFEEREVPVQDAYDYPEPGRVTRFRKDTNETLWERPMTLAEKQMTMGFLMGEDARPEPPKEPPDEAGPPTEIA
jgi:hypothetical protein